MPAEISLYCDNEAPQTGVFKNDWITLWVIQSVIQSVSDTALSLPTTNGKLVLHCDSSHVAIGATFCIL